MGLHKVQIPLTPFAKGGTFKHSFYSFQENVFGCVIARRYTKKYNLLSLALPKTFS